MIISICDPHFNNPCSRSVQCMNHPHVIIPYRYLLGQTKHKPSTTSKVIPPWIFLHAKIRLNDVEIYPVDSPTRTEPKSDRLIQRSPRGTRDFNNSDSMFGSAYPSHRCANSLSRYLPCQTNNPSTNSEISTTLASLHVSLHSQRGSADGGGIRSNQKSLFIKPRVSNTARDEQVVVVVVVVQLDILVLRFRRYVSPCPRLSISPSISVVI